MEFGFGSPVGGVPRGKQTEKGEYFIGARKGRVGASRRILCSILCSEEMVIEAISRSGGAMVDGGADVNELSRTMARFGGACRGAKAFEASSFDSNMGTYTDADVREIEVMPLA